MIFVGIDPGLNPTIAVISEDMKFIQANMLHTSSVKSVTGGGIDEEIARVKLTGQHLASYLAHLGQPAIIGLERVSFGSPFRASLMGRIEYSIHEAVLYSPFCMGFHLIPPTTIKKLAGGYGRLKKAELAGKVKTLVTGWRYKAYMLDDNATDAIGIAISAKMLYEGKG